MDLQLAGKTALVTGASTGIGRGIALALAAEGVQLAIAARRVELLEALASEITTAGGPTPAVIACDLYAEDAAARLAGDAAAALGHVDILVNNAGCNWAAPAEDYPDAGWRKVMGLNVDAQFALAREIGRRSMIPRRSGKIVNIASISGLYGNPPDWNMQTIAYNTSKGGLINFTKTLAGEWARHGIRVNAIAPGFFPSKMSQGILAVIDKQILAMTPMGRLGGDADLMGPAIFLASEASSYVTGHILHVDGGMSAV